jgi:hypothetical protein
MTPYLIFRTFLILVAGAAFVKLLEGHPAGILAMGFAAIGSLMWLIADLNRLAAVGLQSIGGP